MGPSRRIRSLGLREQRAWLTTFHPQLKVLVSGDVLTAEGVIQPTQISRAYQCVFKYRYKHQPEVRVMSPALRRRTSGEPIPHTYQADQPCLFVPNTREWNSSKKIAFTLVPWTALWLFYYEAWHATGEWLGGGVHPPERVRAMTRPSREEREN